MLTKDLLFGMNILSLAGFVVMFIALNLTRRPGVAKIWSIALMSAGTALLLVGLAWRGGWKWRASLGLLLFCWIVATSMQNIWSRVRSQSGESSLLSRLKTPPRSYYGMHLAHIGVAVFIDVALRSHAAEVLVTVNDCWTLVSDSVVPLIVTFWVIVQLGMVHTVR